MLYKNFDIHKIPIIRKQNSKLKIQLGRYAQNEIISLSLAIYWIGAYDPSMNGTWRWLSDNSVALIYIRKVGELPFNNGEPNDFNGEECCVEILNGKGNDIGCTSSLPRTLCEMSGISCLIMHLILL